jgi:hypothetical protein
MGSLRRFDESIEVVGSEEYVDQVMDALEILKSKSSAGYDIVKKYIGRIRESETSGMVAYEDPPTFNMSRETALKYSEENRDYSLQWCISCIVHDAYHSKLYHEYRDKHLMVPDRIWTGTDAELASIEQQKQVCEDIGAHEQLLAYLETLDGTYHKDPRSW